MREYKIIIQIMLMRELVYIKYGNDTLHNFFTILSIIKSNKFIIYTISS